jgi:hypothetical protein
VLKYMLQLSKVQGEMGSEAERESDEMKKIDA